jgi:hypothetical protein
MNSTSAGRVIQYGRVTVKITAVINNAVVLFTCAKSSLFKRFGDVGQNCQMARPLDSRRQHPLMMSATSGNPARYDLAPLGDKTPQEPLIPVIDLLNSVLAKATMSFSSLIHNTLYLS